jgi:sugar phosphate isomerase/epimerase
MNTSRRDFLTKSSLLTSAIALSPFSMGTNLFAASEPKMKLGLVTYLWGKDWDLPTLIANCEKSNLSGVELRTEHAHGVEISLSSNQRVEVKKRFEDSPVEVVGYGSNYAYDNPDPEVLRKSIEDTKKYIKLCQDIGASGIKVKPNQFHEGVPKEKTLKQIGESLRELGEFGSDYGQEIRLEVHGPGTSELPNIKKIMDVADHPNVGVCWNCNDVDLYGEGLDYNFNLVKDRFGSTVHVRELNIGPYPYQELVKLLVDMDYEGWILLECRTNPDDKVAAIIEQDKVFKEMIENAKK